MSHKLFTYFLDSWEHPALISASLAGWRGHAFCIKYESVAKHVSRVRQTHPGVSYNPAVWDSLVGTLVLCRLSGVLCSCPANRGNGNQIPGIYHRPYTAVCIVLAAGPEIQANLRFNVFSFLLFLAFTSCCTVKIWVLKNVKSWDIWDPGQTRRGLQVASWEAGIFLQNRK